MARLVQILAQLAVAILVLAGAADAFAGDDKVVLWRVDRSAVEHKIRKGYDGELKRVLARARQKHIVTEAALLRHLERQPLQVPACYEGTKPCQGVADQLMHALRVNGVVRGKLAPDGGENFVLELDYFQDYGGSAKTVSKSGRIDQIVPAAVAELFTLEAEVEVVTVPEGANLYVNGNLVGVTPIRVSLPEGLHAIRAETENYEVLRTEVALSPAEQKTLDLTLVPKETHVTVVTRAPEAQVFIDGIFLGMAGQPIDVAPGDHELELQAKGYRDISITFDIEAAQRRTINLAMLPQVEDPWEMRERAITRYPLYLEGGYDLSFQGGDFGSVGGEPFGDAVDYRISGFGDASETTLLYNGFNIAAGWTHEYFGLSIIGFSLGVANLDSPVSLTAENGRSVRDVQGNNVLRVGLYPLQGTARYLWGAWGVHGRTGFGANFDRFVLDETNQEIVFSEVNGFWNIAGEGRFYWAEDWYAALGYQLDVDFNGSRGPRHGVVARVGFALPLLVDRGDESVDDLPDTIETIDGEDPVEADPLGADPIEDAGDPPGEGSAEEATQ